MKKQGIIIALVIVLLLAIGGGVAFFIISNNNEDKDDDKDNKSTSEKMDEDDDEYYDDDDENYYDDDDDEYYNDDEENDGKSTYDKASNTVKDASSSLAEQAKAVFNAKFEFYEGSSKGAKVKSLIQAVISSNKEYEGEREVTVEMADEEYSTSSELSSMSSKIVTANKYDVSFEYDDDGYIDTVIIE